MTLSGAFDGTRASTSRCRARAPPHKPAPQHLSAHYTPRIVQGTRARTLRRPALSLDSEPLLDLHDFSHRATPAMSVSIRRATYADVLGMQECNTLCL